MASSSGSTTKSIDVGGVFLMDLAVNDSEGPAAAIDEFAPSGRSQRRHQMAAAVRPLDNYNYEHYHNYNDHHHHQDKSIRLSPTYHLTNNENNELLYGGRPAAAVQQQQQQQEQPPRSSASDAGHLGSSLDRLASVINCDGQQQQQPDQSAALMLERAGGRSYSLSDESYVASSGTSLSASLSDAGSQLSDGLHAIAVNDHDDDEDDKASTTTREDSGVLDMRDLEGQLAPSCKSGGRHSGELVPLSLEQQQQQQPHRGHGQEKSISANTTATNLINNNNKKKKRSANGGGDQSNKMMNLEQHQYQQQANNNKINYNKQQQHNLRPRSITKPTDGAGEQQEQQHVEANNHHNNHNHNHQAHNNNNNNNNHRSDNRNAKRAVSASLPIQVPARQMKRDLNRMKLNLMKEEEQELQLQQQQQQQVAAAGQKIFQARDALAPTTPPLDIDTCCVSPVRKGDRNRPAPLENIAALCGGLGEDDAFLDQEFNANHHNHYPVDECDDENLTAGSDPMRLFASIQALAKSLHEDAELFGSLPPKRLLESPIRSLALV